MNSVPVDPLIGQTLDGRYAIRSRIARGGMAMVYLAHDLRLERRIAVKVMHQHLAEDEAFTRRFEQEARSAAGLSHPNLVGVFDQGHDAGRTYLVMEYLPSITLRDLLKKQKHLTTEEATEISEAVLAGLAAAHSAGIVHRDLKPENVLLADDGRIKLGDFGLARAVSANTTTGQALLGTIAYLSPELVTRGVADARSDLYAFGIMLYEMLTGSQPFTGEQPMQIAYQHAHSDVPVPSDSSAEATPELDELVRWTTQRDPELRPRDAGEAHAYLTAVQQGQPTAAHTRVMDFSDDTSVLATPSTAVLDPLQRQQLSEADAPKPEASATPAPGSPASAAAAASARRATRGKIVAAVLTVLVVLAGGLGWWFGQGPGSRTVVPNVAGMEWDAAVTELQSIGLNVEVFECPSLEIEAGRAVRTEPESGARVDRATSVQLCRSTGPEQLNVPTLIGLTEAAAKNKIEDARFTFGSVVEERFGPEEAGTVIAALDEAGSGLGAQYSERGRVDLILSAGPLPGVDGLTVDEARSVLAGKQLSLDEGLNSTEHSDSVETDRVIGLVPGNDPMRPGDSVGLTISLGPELFEIPNLDGLSVREAMQALTDAGFAPVTSMLEILWDEATVKSLSPKAGEAVPKGTEVRVRGTFVG